MRRGEIYWATFEPRSGSEQRDRRPAIVMSSDGFNLTPSWRSVMVLPLTTAGAQARRGPTAVEVEAGVGGLPKAGFALCHQITTLDRAKLAGRLGALPSEDLARVEAGIRLALDLP